MKSKLKVKLTSLFDLISSEYIDVWDTCCDHGQLGLAFLETSKSKVYFVDQVESITKKLKLRLNSIPELDDKNYEILCCEAQIIKIEKHKTLICISGVGGEVVIQIIKELAKHNDLSDCDFLLSPQYQLFEVRSFLRENNFKRLNEGLVFEGKWGRELLLVRQGSGEEIDEIGKSLFDTKNQLHLDYLNGIISHLENKKNLKVAKKYMSILS